MIAAREISVIIPTDQPASAAPASTNRPTRMYVAPCSRCSE